MIWNDFALPSRTSTHGSDVLAKEWYVLRGFKSSQDVATRPASRIKDCEDERTSSVERAGVEVGRKVFGCWKEVLSANGRYGINPSFLFEIRDDNHDHRTKNKSKDVCPLASLY
jgi:hypothetical protein